MSKRPPPSQDQQNNERNQYIPSFISKAPFYAEGLSDSDYLEHQRLHSQSKDTLDKAKWYDRGRKAGPAATKYRKGACENCGAMTHKTKECLSRPRKQGAKWTGRDIQADERIDDVKLGWDAKRDRWNGYDSREYDAVVQEYNELEELRQQAQLQSQGDGDDASNRDTAERLQKPEDGARYEAETDMGRSQPTSTRQLRLREDTAKYLVNLDLDSAKYDPKTRTMETASNSGPGKNGEFDGFVRPDESGAFERAQRYAWESQENNSGGPKLHLQANPTEGEVLMRKRAKEEDEKKASQVRYLADKYGATTTTDDTNSTSSPTTIQQQQRQRHKPSTITSSEAYVEYDARGLPKEQFRTLKAPARSKYAEDVLTNNHTAVWGSHWDKFQWGYACCHSTVKNSYCTGEAGKVAFSEAESLRTGRHGLLLLEEHGQEPLDLGSDPANQTDQAEHVDAEEPEQKPKRTDEDGENVQTTRTATPDGKNKKNNYNKRTLAELHGGITDEEMEAYKRNKMAANDPMNNFNHLSGEEVLQQHGK